MNTILHIISLSISILTILSLSGCEEQSMNMDIFELTSEELIESISINSQELNTSEDGTNHSVIKKVITTSSEHKIEPVSCHNQDIVKYFIQQQSEKKVKGCGSIVRLLPDDIQAQGVQHQKFIMQLDGVIPEHSVLVTHNINLAPRLEGLQIGDTVMVYGMYEYNEDGGVIYHTHHDSHHHQSCGWIEFNSRRYQ